MIASIRRALRQIVPALLLVALVAASASAQSRVRVKDDGTSIWRSGFSTVLTVAAKGDEFRVVSQRDTWYEIVVPAADGRAETRGFIAKSRVEPIGSEAVPEFAPRQSVGSTADRSRRTTGTGVGLRLFLSGGYGRFSASETFAAVMGSANAGWFGGGIDVRMPGGLFVAGSVDRFKKTGERVFVFNGEVFPLGVKDTVTIVPLALTAGYGLNSRSAIRPYVGGGIGRYLYKETSPVATDEEKVDLHPTAYHALGGVEWRGDIGVSTAFEAQYTWVPDALTGSVANGFDEHDLGGLQLRVKILFGR